MSKKETGRYAARSAFQIASRQYYRSEGVLIYARIAKEGPWNIVAHAGVI